jgi:2-succinyl-6-hydroxy-2,4-cyclohexadiene-1-carboxylate synthase
VETWGPEAAPPLLLLHGFTGTAAGWRRDASWAGIEHKVLAPDLPGHGARDSPPDAFGLLEAAEDLREILDVHAVSRASVIGYSMGGRLALHLAVAHPERVGRLVLVGVSPGIVDPAGRAARLEEDAAWVRLLREGGTGAFLDEWLARPLFDSLRRLPPERFAAVRRERAGGNASGLAAALLAFGAGRQAPLHERLSRVGAPALLVAGERDPKYVRFAEEMATRMARGSVAIIPGAGHAPHMEMPERFRECVEPFLDAVRSETEENEA